MSETTKRAVIIPESLKQFWNKAWTEHCRTLIATSCLIVSSITLLWVIQSWVVLLMLTCFLWRWRIDHVAWTLGRQLRIIGIALILLIVVFITHGLAFDGVIASAQLFVFCWLKLVEVRSRSDWALQIMLCFLLISASAIHYTSFFHAVYCAFAVAYVTYCLLHMDAPDPIHVRPRDIIRSNKRLLYKAIPLGILLFVLLPRPEIQFGLQRSKATTGISERLNPGDIAELSESNSLAFRAEFPDGNIPPKSDWYWRGPVLTNMYRGKTWYSHNGLFKEFPNIPPNRSAKEPSESNQYNYVIYFSATNQRWLVSLDHPTTIPTGHGIRPGFTLATESRVLSDIRYEVSSAARSPVYAFTPENLNGALLLPEGIDSRIVQLGQDIAQNQRDGATVSKNILTYFKDEGYVYTMKPGTMDEQNPYGDFLFSKRQGFCGHYATAFTLLMRSAGIPTRIVTGYRGGTWNEYGEFIEVRQKRAHAWNEYWDNEEGWVRVDPTDAVPNIDRNDPVDLLGSEDEETNEEIVNWEESSDNTSWLGQLRQEGFLLLTLIDHSWDRYFLSYDSSSQESLLEKVGLERIGNVGLILTMILLFPPLVWLTIRLWPQARDVKDPLVGMYLNFWGDLAKLNIIKTPQHGPLEAERTLSQQFPQAQQELSFAFQIYRRFRYEGKTPNKDDLRKAKQAWSAASDKIKESLKTNSQN